MQRLLCLTCNGIIWKIIPLWTFLSISCIICLAFLLVRCSQCKSKQSEHTPRQLTRVRVLWFYIFLCTGSFSFSFKRSDNTGNLPYEGRNFNTQTFMKMYLFVVCMNNRNWFQTKLLLYIASCWGFWGKKNVFFHYIIHQERNKFIKHCPPVYQEAYVSL